MISLELHRDTFPTEGTFTIARGSRTSAEVIAVTLRDGPDGVPGGVAKRGVDGSAGKEASGAVGRGECVPYGRYGESLDSVAARIESMRGPLRDGLDRAALQHALPAGAARNALDCALWDLEAKRRGMPVWQLAGLARPGAVTTAYTLSLDAPDAMREAAHRHAARPLLKIKLGGEGETDIARLEAVRAGAPDARLIVDANEGWGEADYDRLAGPMRSLGVALVEQPLPAGDDAALGERARPLPVCADEACHDRGSLAALAGRYDLVNVKLDKSGGLTEALALVTAARGAGFGVMVGCMVGSSLAMAPALLVAQGADYVDLDGPLLLAADREPPLRYVGSEVSPADPALWG